MGAKRAKMKSGSPEWIRATITLSNAKSVSYRDSNGLDLECPIGPEKPPLVHNSYTEGANRFIGAPPALARSGGLKGTLTVPSWTNISARCDGLYDILVRRPRSHRAPTCEDQTLPCFPSRVALFS